MTKALQIPQKPTRHFFPEDLLIDSWEKLKAYFDALLNRDVSDTTALENWLSDLSEVEAVLEEDMAWRYIRMTIDTKDKDKTAAYTFFVSEIQPELSRVFNALNKKLMGAPGVHKLQGKAFEIMLRKIRKDLEMFREENIPLQSELQQLSQQYGSITGALEIEVEGQKMTMQKAGAELQKTDRKHREEVFSKILTCRNGVADALNNLFNQLIEKRNIVAKNAGYDNFRDYMFDALGRFDYSKEDCFAFHKSIAQEISPIAKSILEKRKKNMGLSVLRPWDLSVDPFNRAPLKPFETGTELIEKSIRVFDKVDPYFGDCLRIMQRMGHLDLESKSGKAPGGYNYPLYEIGVPFIFMNAVGTPRDLVTMMHEGGHAVHSFLTRDLEHSSFKSCPSEVAELASMSMELISMDHWDEFYPDAETLKRAKIDHLEDILGMLPWIAIIDKFQHWLYENPGHSADQRTTEWMAILEMYSAHIVDYSGLEGALENSWQKQLHLFEVPFYYIEYGMAQLGAIAVWRNYKQSPQKAIADYKAALSLGYTQTIGDIYATAGIKFDFSAGYIKELADFVRAELVEIAGEK